MFVPRVLYFAVLLAGGKEKRKGKSESQTFLFSVDDALQKLQIVDAIDLDILVFAAALSQKSDSAAGCAARVSIGHCFIQW